MCARHYRGTANVRLHISLVFAESSSPYTMSGRRKRRARATVSPNVIESARARAVSDAGCTIFSFREYNMLNSIHAFKLETAIGVFVTKWSMSAVEPYIICINSSIVVAGGREFAPLSFYLSLHGRTLRCTCITHVIKQQNARRAVIFECCLEYST